MQILPGERSDSLFGFYMGTSETASTQFAEAMQDAATAVAEGDHVSATSALAEQPLVEAPYSRQTTDGVTYTLEEVCFTKNELQELREQLLKEGAPEETLKRFDVLASQPDGATLAQVLASLNGLSPVRLGKDDEQAITALMGQIDPSGDLAANVLSMMREGNGAGALEMIQNGLAKLGSGEIIDVDLASVLALGRGLGLDNGHLNTLAASFGGANSLSLNAAQFDTLMNPAKAQFLELAAGQAKLDEALDKTLKSVISRARNRMEKEREAAERESRRVAQSRILIDETVQEKSRQIIDGTVSQEEIAANADKTQQVEGQLQQPGQDKPLAGKDNGLVSQEGKSNQFAQGREMASEQHGQPHSDGETGNDFSSDQGWDNFLGKLTTRPAPTMNTSSVVYSMLQGNPLSPLTETNPILANPVLSQQLSSQVEQGILTAMRDGATRLDLQLHPAELGAITITLIARNGEVTAQLRSEKSETAELMTRQLDAMRLNLEQQGIKVDKIEVQLENRQQPGNDFANLDQHNARQEENARRQEMMRMRNLAALRNADNSLSLAQSVHESRQLELSTPGSISIMA